MAEPPGSAFLFEPFRLDPSAFRLLMGDRPIPLAPKALDLLLLLVQRPATLVSKETIMRELWPDVAVTDNALTQVISDLRQALGDEPGKPRFIETVPRRGYRFIATVEKSVSPIGDAVAPSGPFAAVASGPTPPMAVRAGVRETSNVDAYRSFTDGRLKLERMDPSEVPSAIADFNRAISLDPRYAPPHVGLAHARFWIFEASRARNKPDGAQLIAAIADLQRAIDLDPDLAEAHAALAMLLTAAWRTPEAVEAGRRSVALDPGNWRNHCRYAIAAWGSERIAAFEQVLALYPEFAYAYYGIAMVHVARNSRSDASQALRLGIPLQDRSTGSTDRFPAKGLHWLLGLVHLASGDSTAAHEEFDRELSTGGRGVYDQEFAANACDGHGFAFLREQRLEESAAMFERALQTYPDHVRSLLGLADASRRRGLVGEREQALARAASAIEVLEANGRGIEAALSRVLSHVVCDRPLEALAVLDRLLTTAPPGFAGWLTPVEPLLAPLASAPSFKNVLARLADRAV